MPLTQSQMIAAVADRAELSKADAKRALEALDEVVLEELGNAQKVRLGGLVQLTVRVKPATKKRTGRNPAIGEQVTIAAKPASVGAGASAGEGRGCASVATEDTAAAGGLERARGALTPGPRRARSADASPASRVQPPARACDAVRVWHRKPQPQRRSLAVVDRGSSSSSEKGTLALLHKAGAHRRRRGVLRPP